MSSGKPVLRTLSSVLPEVKVQYDKMQQIINDNKYAWFDGFGLRFPTEFLSSNRLGVATLPVEMMAEFVDYVTHEMVASNTFSAAALEAYETITPEIFSKLNTTSFGNIAYIALNHSDASVRLQAQDIVAQIQQLGDKALLDHMHANAAKS